MILQTRFCGKLDPYLKTRGSASPNIGDTGLKMNPIVIDTIVGDTT